MRRAILKGTKEMLGFFGRKQLLTLSLLVIGAVFLTLSAYQENQIAVICLGIFALALGAISQLYSGLCEDMLKHGKETLDWYVNETKFSGELVSELAGAIGKLYNHDPVVAEQYRQRLAEALVEHSPALREAIAEKGRTAGLN